MQGGLEQPHPVTPKNEWRRKREKEKTLNWNVNALKLYSLPDQWMITVCLLKSCFLSSWHWQNELGVYCPNCQVCPPPRFSPQHASPFPESFSDMQFIRIWTIYSQSNLSVPHICCALPMTNQSCTLGPILPPLMIPSLCNRPVCKVRRREESDPRGGCYVF